MEPFGDETRFFNFSCSKNMPYLVGIHPRSCVQYCSPVWVLWRRKAPQSQSRQRKGRAGAGGSHADVWRAAGRCCPSRCSAGQSPLWADMQRHTRPGTRGQKYCRIVQVMRNPYAPFHDLVPLLKMEGVLFIFTALNNFTFFSYFLSNLVTCQFSPTSQLSSIILPPCEGEDEHMLSSRHVKPTTWLYLFMLLLLLNHCS